MAYGQAKSYSDFYKQNDETASTENNDIRGASAKKVEARKAVMQRRLKNKKKVGMQ